MQALLARRDNGPERKLLKMIEFDEKSRGHDPQTMDPARSERMKPLSIADYLDRLGSAIGENAPPRREGSPFRPRSLPGPRNGKPALKPVFNGEPKTGGADQTASEDAPRRSAWAPKPVQLQAAARKSPPTEELTKPDDIPAKVNDAYARGREQGLAEGRVEASDRHAAELAAAREQAETQQQELRLSEYAELEASIRSGLKQVEDNIRRRRRPHSRAISITRGRQTRRERIGQGHRQAKRGQPSRLRSKFADPSACLRSCGSE